MTAPTPAERREWATSLLEGTTPGPWHAYYNVHGDPFVVADPGRPSFTNVATVSTAADDYGRADCPLLAAAPDLAAAVRDLADELANRDAILGAVAQSVDALTAERDALREQVERQAAALREGRMALARAIGLLEAHWEVCADPFPDASLRRALDRLDSAEEARP